MIFGPNSPRYSKSQKWTHQSLHKRKRNSDTLKVSKKRDLNSQVVSKCPSTSTRTKIINLTLCEIKKLRLLSLTLSTCPVLTLVSANLFLIRNRSNKIRSTLRESDLILTHQRFYRQARKLKTTTTKFNMPKELLRMKLTASNAMNRPVNASLIFKKSSECANCSETSRKSQKKKTSKNHEGKQLKNAKF